jgi:DNA-binding beta-propeller fold protein YncE
MNKMKPTLLTPRAGKAAGAICILLGFGLVARADVLYVSDEGNPPPNVYNAGVIYEYASNGTRSAFATGLDSPIGLAFDSSGNLYVANSGGSGGSIEKFAPNGSSTIFALGTNPQGLNGPYGLAFDQVGNLYEADEAIGYIWTCLALRRYDVGQHSDRSATRLERS